MNTHLNSQDCRRLISELAEILPKKFRESTTNPWFEFDSDMDIPELRQKWDPVFTGGAIVGLLLTDSAAPPPSKTKDIDIVLEIVGYHEFAVMEQVLRVSGFTQKHIENMPIVAWHWNQVRVDFLPHLPMEMMKSNRWFPNLISEAERIEVMPGKFAWCASAPCFLATKFEAFFSRGRGNYVESKDIEDILAIIDGRETLQSEIVSSAPEVARFLIATLRELESTPAFVECLTYSIAENSRAEIVMERIRNIIQK